MLADPRALRTASLAASFLLSASAWAASETGSAGATLVGVDRGQSLRVSYAPDGFRTSPRSLPTGDADAWTWGLSFVAWGRGDDLACVPSATPRLAGDRVEYRRGPIDEWYVNDHRGLEQGFCIAWAEPGAEPLRLDFAVLGGLAPVLDAGRDLVDFRSAAGVREVRLAHLYVFDANGRELPSRFGLEGDRLSILVDDRDAVYPIVIDPLASTPAWIGEGNQLVANYGYSVAGIGDVNGDGFADVAVGAPFASNGQASEGRVFVYLGSASGLPATPAWTGEINQVGANFGLSVAGAGDVNGDGFDDLIVGAPGFDDVQPNSGRASLYLGSPAGIVAIPAWTGVGTQTNAFLGAAVAGAGDVNGDGFDDVLVGAPRYDGGQVDEGRASLYLGTAEGLSTTPAWTAEGDQLEAHFGAAVAGAGDVNGDGFDDLIVGAPEFNDGQNDEGLVALYYGSRNGPELSPGWFAEGQQAGARFGNAVAGAGDVNGDGLADVIVGAYLYDAGQVDEGRVFCYLGATFGLEGTAAWSVDGEQAGANLGTSVGCAGDTGGDGFDDVIVGAFGFDGTSTNEGIALVFDGSTKGLAVVPSWSAEGDQAGAFFGTSVAGAGDVNDDGAGDVLVGAPYVNSPKGDEGSASLFLGSAPASPADLNGDGAVNASDLAILLSAWGTAAADLDGNGTTGAADLSILLAAWS